MHTSVTKVYYWMCNGFLKRMNVMLHPPSFKLTGSDRNDIVEPILLCRSHRVYHLFQNFGNHISVINVSVIQTCLKLIEYGCITVVGHIHFCFDYSSDLENSLLTYLLCFFQGVHAWHCHSRCENIADFGKYLSTWRFIWAHHQVHLRIDQSGFVGLWIGRCCMMAAQCPWHLGWMNSRLHSFHYRWCLLILAYS